MKKILMILTVLLTTGVLMAQNKPQTFIQGNVATSNTVFYQSLEVGATTGKNRLSVVAESFSDDSVSRDERQWFGGIVYTRAIPVGKKLDFLMIGKALVHVDNDFALSVEPGVGIGWNVSKGVAFIGTMTSPIHQNTKPFNQVQLKAGVGVQVKL